MFLTLKKNNLSCLVNTSMAWNDDKRGDGFFERTMACIQKAD
ncbi:MAG: hypothetical protein R8G66_15810 [Cytophagales bacterium]|nr:hypothetical protein [Cytophagales bacterium]